ERIQTEDSYKYSFQEIGELAEAAGLEVEHRYLDADKRFSLNLFAARRLG
ncbi:MAG: L-histidine N(alpha)-methyltransferase, partial [Deltaproteobacteria bacterium]|nr:L-histidine N(alpha)-methyltransferase [Deltaproteobacteria bacterium]